MEKIRIDQLLVDVVSSEAAPMLFNLKLIASVEGNVHTATYNYEPGRNAMSSLTNTVSSTTVSGYASRYDALGRRINVTRTGTAMVQDFLSKYGYDSLGQLTADQRYTGTNPEAPETALEEETFAFLYDTIGNRQSATVGAETTDYSANLLNQYGLIGSYEPVCDADGNLLSDLQYTYTWNGENRLIRVEPIVATEGSTRVEFTYDYLGRRVKKSVWLYESGSWTEESVKAFVYDGWNLIEEISSDSVDRVYTWGLDLSGSLQGAGGVGGLLAQSRTDSSDTQTYYYTYDFNGNVSELLDASGSIAAHYEYGAFGELIWMSGTFADENTFRFSTKYTDSETGLLYYGYRYYDPTVGRWASRDPLEEDGGVNLYGFVGNDAVSYVDPLGLAEIEFRGLVGFGVGFDSNGRLSPSFSITLSGKSECSDNLDIVADLVFRTYAGGQGTSNSRYTSGFDIGALIKLTYGDGQFNEIKIRGLNRFSSSAFTNDYSDSVSIGGGWNYNSSTGKTTNSHSVSGRVGSIAIHYQNDMGKYPFLPFPSGDSDESWTAGAILDVVLENGQIVEFGYEQFTGVPDYSFVADYPSFYPQLQNDYDLNLASTFLGISQGSSNYRVGYSGSHWGQNIVHSHRNIPIFEKTGKNSEFFEWESNLSGSVNDFKLYK